MNVIKVSIYFLKKTILTRGELEKSNIHPSNTWKGNCIMNSNLASVKKNSQLIQHNGIIFFFSLCENSMGISNKLAKHNNQYLK